MSRFQKHFSLFHCVLFRRPWTTNSSKPTFAADGGAYLKTNVNIELFTFQKWGSVDREDLEGRKHGASNTRLRARIVLCLSTIGSQAMDDTLSPYRTCATKQFLTALAQEKTSELHSFHPQVQRIVGLQSENRKWLCAISQATKAT